MDSQQQYIPDSQGTIVVKADEGAVARFKTAKAFFDQLEETVDAAKESFRSMAKEVLARAAPGALRVLFSDKAGGGVMCPRNDPESMASYTDLAAKETASTLAKAGGLSALETAGLKLTDIVDTTESVTLQASGPWAAWFKSQISAFLQSKSVTEEVAAKGVKWSTTMKLKPTAVAKLRELALLDTEAGKVARVLLDVGLRKISVDVK
jgi:hypothetical protein